jgi:excisionase family DNA binding protein
MTTVRTATSSQVATTLGLRIATVQRYARDGRIPSDKTPGGHRRFDIDEVRAALSQESKPQTPPPAKFRGTRGWLVDALELEGWAERLVAREELPGLVRVLVIGSTTDLRSVDFRSGEGIGMTGWDGQVDAVQGNPWVPAGQSVWEMGVNEDVTGKANSDYATRKDDPQGVVPSETTFVFVTPRRWPNKDAWVTEKRAEKVWKDVRAYDADTLEAWLDSNPAVHTRVTRMMGRDPDGASDLVAAWERWSRATLPPVPSGLLLAGRESAAESFVAWLRNESAVITVQSESSEESFAFIAATILSLPEDAQEVVVQRTLVVHSPQAWDEVIARASPGTRLLLIPMFSMPHAVEASGIGHQVVIPADRNTPTAGTPFTLPRVKRQAAAQALITAGLAEQEAHQLAGIARRSLLMFRRRISANASSLPDWATPANAGEIVPLILAGAWQEGSPGDEDFLSKLCARPYADVSAACTRWSGQSDMPVRREASQWFCVSKRDAWHLVAHHATAGTLAAFRSLAVNMLTTADPALSLETDKRWAAGLYGHSLPWSTNLMVNLVDSLALIATSTGDFTFPNGATGQAYVDSIVRESLECAIADESQRLWPSLNYALPYMAEAAPDMYLEMVDRALEHGSLLAVFDPDAEQGVFGHPKHTGLLWSLEVLAWSPDYLGSAAVILALLTEKDPGGRWANRPANSLRQIFLPWHPQTAANFDVRYSALDALREVAPSAAWDTLVALLPSPHVIAESTYSPKWRDWQPDDQQLGLSSAELISHCRELVSRLLADVCAHQSGWADLIKSLPQLPDEQFDAVTNCLSGVDISSLDSQTADTICRELREMVHRHRKYAAADWALPEAKVVRIEHELDRFIGEDQAEAFSSIFSYHPEVSGFEVSGPGYFDALLEKQKEAARSVVSNIELDGIRKIALKCKAPNLLGIALGAVTGNLDDGMLALLESSEEAERRTALGYISSRFSSEGWPWALRLSEKSSEWPQERVVGFLQALPPESATFSLADQQDQEIKKSYWRRCNLYGIESESDRNEAAQALLCLGLYERTIPLFLLLKQKGEDFDANKMLDALRRASFNDETHSEPISSLVYEVKELLAYARDVPGIDRGLLAHVEWKFLPLLDSGPDTPSLILHEELSQSPSFFVELISLIFPRQGSENSEIDVTDEMRHRATQAYSLLKSWKSAPPLTGDGETPVLADWVKETRRLLVEKRLLRYGDSFIGEMLFHACTPSDEWPPVPIRKIFEATRSQKMESGFAIAVMNSRGMTWRSLDAGGQQERSFAEKYKKFAQDVGPRWPRTQRLLRRIADSWAERARQEDHLAEIREDFWS